MPGDSQKNVEVGDKVMLICRPLVGIEQPPLDKGCHSDSGVLAQPISIGQRNNLGGQSSPTVR
jgi:hypothetical protein